VEQAEKEVMETILTKDNIEWLIREASDAQGCLTPEECDANRALIGRMRSQLLDMFARDQSQYRDIEVIDQFLRNHGLKRS
jgi:hypothetical protein